MSRLEAFPQYTISLRRMGIIAPMLSLATQEPLWNLAGSFATQGSHVLISASGVRFQNFGLDSRLQSKSSNNATYLGGLSVEVEKTKSCT